MRIALLAHPAVVPRLTALISHSGAARRRVFQEERLDEGALNTDS